MAEDLIHAPRERSTEASDRELPLESWDYRSLVLTGIFSLLLLCGLYLAREVVVPMVFAFVLNLLLQPLMRVLAGVRIPRALAALLTIILLAAVLAAIGFSLMGPAAAWLAKAPQLLPKLQELLYVFQAPLQRLQDISQAFERLSGTAPGTAVTVRGPGLSGLLFSNTWSMLVGVGTTVILLFFLLVSGDLFLRRLVEIVPTLSNKKQVVDISREIESSISVYLVTISLINLAVGVATGIATYLCGLDDPLLWGALAFVLNYLLILGPLTNFAVLTLVGLLSFDSTWRAFLPAVAYLIIHVLEGETFTPMLMARRFTLNPVLIVASLIFWYWMWGLAGALLAVPMLATLKLVCDRIGPLASLGHFLGGEMPQRDGNGR